MTYVIEHDGRLYGPFESKSDAADFALPKLGTPWTIRAMVTPPLQGVAEDKR